MKKITQSLAILSLASLGLVACGSGGSAEADTVKVVATTDVYADIVRTVAGDTVQVTSIINSTSQDPHSYEATSTDRLTVKDADLVVLNGGGYDQFMEDMAGSDNQEQQIANAVEVSGLFSAEEITELTEGHSHEEGEEHNHDHGALNEHVWYSLEAMKNLAREIATDLGKISPDHADQYSSAAEEFGGTIDTLIADAQNIAGGGKQYVSTEPVPDYLLQTAGFDNATPADLTSAVEAESDIAPLTLQEIKESLADGQINFLAYNQQTSTSQTNEILQAAQDNGVANVSFTETLPEGKNYSDWMADNISNIRNAVAP